MVNRQTQLSSGGTVLVRESVLRGSGPRGAVGPQGTQGPAIHIVGTKPTSSHIFALGGTEQTKHAYGWVADDTGVLWVWYRTNPGIASDLSGSWSNAGVMRGNPGYLNSVAAKAEQCSKTSEVNRSISENTPAILLWNLTHVDTEVVPTEVVGGQVRENQAKPIVVGWRIGDGSNAQSLTDIDRVQPVVPPVETALSYPFGSSVYIVNISMTFDPALAIRSGAFTTRLYWTTDATNRTLVAEHTDVVTSDITSVGLTTYIRGLVGGMYEVEVQSTAAGTIRERRWEWIRAGGGPGPKGDTGAKGDPPRVHPASPAATPVALEGITGDFVGQLILVQATGDLYMWQMAPDNSGNMWVIIGNIKGVPGNANTGFAQFDDVVGAANLPPGTDSSHQGPIAPLVTPDQALPYPAHNHQPRVPFHHKSLVDKIETMLVGRFSTAAQRLTKRISPNAGEVSWVDGSASHERGMDVYIAGSHTEKYLRVPLVIMSSDTNATPGQTNYPDGTLWIRYG